MNAVNTTTTIINNAIQPTTDMEATAACSTAINAWIDVFNASNIALIVIFVARVVDSDTILAALKEAWAVFCAVLKVDWAVVPAAWDTLVCIPAVFIIVRPCFKAAFTCRLPFFTDSPTALIVLCEVLILSLTACLRCLICNASPAV